MQSGLMLAVSQLMCLVLFTGSPLKLDLRDYTKRTYGANGNSVSRMGHFGVFV